MELWLLYACRRSIDSLVQWQDSYIMLCDRDHSRFRSCVDLALCRVLPTNEKPSTQSLVYQPSSLCLKANTGLSLIWIAAVAAIVGILASTRSTVRVVRIWVSGIVGIVVCVGRILTAVRALADRYRCCC